MMTLERRPFLAVVAMLALVTAIVFDLVACGGSSDTTGESGPPTEVRVPAPARYAAGQEVIAHSGCLACHQIGESGNRNLASDLTHIGSRIPRSAIVRALNKGPAIMPSYASLGDRRLNEVVDFLVQLN
jgi:quinol---cytochrome c reductase cytochrome c subunit, bacillus type